MPMIVDSRLLLVVAERMGAPPASADLLRETGSIWRIVRRKSPLVALFFMGYEVLWLDDCSASMGYCPLFRCILYGG